MGTGMFIRCNGQFVEMTEQPYDTEDELQEYLAKYPDLLPGDQIDSRYPCRWLLITREKSVADPSGVNRWSLDHRFLDQFGIPTLVEVKRRSDPRIRREVVAQMLDYAANAVKYWEIDELQAAFQKTCRDQGKDPEQTLAQFLMGSEAEGFWRNVLTNLRDSRIRLIFIADTIPMELQSVVEFLNNQMDRTEVLAVEVKKYIGECAGEELLVLRSRLIGRTAEAVQKKEGGVRQERLWDEQSLLDELVRRKGERTAHVAKRILEWAEGHRLNVTWGKGPKVGEFSAGLVADGKPCALITPWTDGNITVEFGSLQQLPPFTSADMRLELLKRVNEAAGLSLAPNVITKFPSVPMANLEAPEALTRFIAVLDWMVGEIRKANSCS